MVTITVEDDNRRVVYEADDVLTHVEQAGNVEVCHAVEFIATSTTITRKAQLGETFIDDNEIVYMRAASREDVYKILGRIDRATQELRWCNDAGNMIHGLPASAKKWPDAH